MSGWDVETYGRLQAGSILTDTSRGKRPASPASVWWPIEPQTAASGSATIAETTVALPAGATAPEGTAAIQYAIVGRVGAGSGSIQVRIVHRSGGGIAGAVEASNALGCQAWSNAWVDWNRGRLTYSVVATGSPASILWAIYVVGFLRAA